MQGELPNPLQYYKFCVTVIKTLNQPCIKIMNPNEYLTNIGMTPTGYKMLFWANSQVT